MNPPSQPTQSSTDTTSSIRMGDVLFFTILAVMLLTVAAFNAGEGWSDSVDTAVKWVKDTVGLAGVVAGFFGFKETVQAANENRRLAIGSTSVVSVLAGATLLEVGDWVAPAAMAFAAGTLVGVQGLRMWQSKTGGP